MDPKIDKSSFSRYIPIRKLRTDITTVFLSLLALSSIAIILFTYLRNYAGTQEIANALVQELDRGVVEKIRDTLKNTQTVASLSEKIVLKNSEVTPDNQGLIQYFIHALQIEPSVYSMIVASSDDNYMSVQNISLSQTRTYHLNPSKSLPQGTKYAIRYIHRSSPPFIESWKYLDTDLNILDAIEAPYPTYDPIVDNWYLNTIRWPHTHWGEALNAGIIQGGILVSGPLRDLKGRIIGAVAANLSLDYLSNYIMNQKLGFSGMVLITDQKGNILLPSKNDLSLLSINADSLARRAFEKFKDTKVRTSLLSDAGKKYYVSVSDLPLSYETKWRVISIVPFDDLFGHLINTALQTIWISLAILFLFGIFIIITSKFISDPIVRLANEVNQIKNFNFDDPPKRTHSHIEEIITLQSSIEAMRNTLKSFTRYVPKRIVHTLIKQGKEIGIGMERKELTLLFSDVANFTTFSEALSNEELSDSLAKYFDYLTKTLLRYELTIDKFMGDGIMAFCNAPQDVPDHADRVCRAALRFIKTYPEEIKANRTPNWHTRFGIHTGDVLVGNVGTRERINYTAIGNAVNTASRLQNMNKDYKTSIIISQTVLEEIGTRFLVRPLNYVAAKGKKNRITIYELVGAMIGEEDLIASKEDIEFCEDFSNAYFDFHEGRVKEAHEKFKALHEKRPDDFPTKFYLSKIEML